MRALRALTYGWVHWNLVIIIIIVKEEVQLIKAHVKLTLTVHVARYFIWEWLGQEMKSNESGKRKL